MTWSPVDQIEAKMADDEKKTVKGKKRRTLSLPGLEKAETSQSELPLGEGPDSVKNIKTESEKIDIGAGEQSEVKKTAKKPAGAARKPKPASKPKPATPTPKSPQDVPTSDLEKTVSEDEALARKEEKQEEARKAKIKRDDERAEKAEAKKAPLAVTAMQRKQSGNLPTLQMNDFAERMPYVLLILVGFGLIVIVKTFTSTPSWIVTMMAVLAIVCYGVFAGLRQGNRMRIDRIGDNCYYLGLTYTLASLISALFGLAGAEVGQRLLEDFGIALGSTAAGVIMRMVLMQFRDELDDVETDARLALTREAKEFESQLRRARQDLDDYKYTVMKSVSSTHEELAEMLKVQARNLKDRNLGTADSLDDRMAAMDSFLEAFTLRSDALLKTAEMLGNSTQSLASRMDSIDAQPETLKSAFSAIGDGLQASENSLIKTAESLERTSKSIEVRNEGADNFMALSERLETRIERLDDTLEKMTTNLQRQLEAVEKGSQVMDAHVAAMKTYTDAAELEGERMRKATASVYESLGSLASTVTREAGRGL
ncbi:hypothetical protein N9W89_08710 [Hellea sp.]|nr:hypothetical protein [Hellea sp.]